MVFAFSSSAGSLAGSVVEEVVETVEDVLCLRLSLLFWLHLVPDLSWVELHLAVESRDPDDGDKVVVDRLLVLHDTKPNTWDANELILVQFWSIFLI